ncbi:protein KINESIN LIGHT CHAIN-RELATED 2 isoform X2 [Brassica napus]|uniref:kinesin light chain isoform X2 n=1 Tax=Brassica oleracea var. oleracea TaxID=109376 RepID=UPI0006A7065B|nr:PREDICTED: kinesin light chain isoform X2 [Brassica oleracea var. oleracea]XP_048618087.1 protein KINESIN LIGHT CHAIN-RELATED 2 isoform X2 [Brassica napus]
MEIGESHDRGKEDSAAVQASPRSPLSSIDLAMDGAMNASIEQLYHNVCEMESSDDQSPSRASFISYGAESRIDLELRHLVGGDVGERKKDVVLEKKEESNEGSKNREGSLSRKKPEKLAKTSPNAKLRISSRKSPDLRKVSVDEESPELGPLLLKQAREMVSSGENLNRALDLALRAVKAFEKRAEGELNLVMSLHILAAIYAGLGKYNEAVPVLERSIEIPMIEDGEDHSLAKFAGCMQLGDMYGLMGQVENSLLLYTAGLEIQRQVLGETDPRVGETCRYLAEAHVQAMQFEEASRLCQMALDIHKENGSTATASIEEAADRKLMGLICDAKGDYEVALEHYVLASMAMSSQNHREDVASIDCSIGDAYMSLARFDESIFAYQKALAVFKQSKGESHSSVASVYVRLADLYNKIGKLRDSKSYCENALRIYLKPSPGTPMEEVATGFIEISAIYQSMNELDQALKLLRRALKIYVNAPGQQNTVAGIEAQMGVISYMMGNYPESYNIFKSAVSKFRNSGEKKTAMFGIALNQLGLACVQRYAINEAADLFEEAKGILENEYGPYHPDTLAVYSNLAGTYDAMGRLEDAIEILEYVVGTRGEKLGMANPEVEDESRG